MVTTNGSAQLEPVVIISVVIHDLLPTTMRSSEALSDQELHDVFETRPVALSAHGKVHALKVGTRARPPAEHSERSGVPVHMDVSRRVARKVAVVVVANEELALEGIGIDTEDAACVHQVLTLGVQSKDVPREQETARVCLRYGQRDWLQRRVVAP